MVDTISTVNDSGLVLSLIEASCMRINQSRREETICWLKAYADWSHAVTLTMHRSKNGYEISKQEVEKRCFEFLNRINRRIYKHGIKRKGFRIASVAFLGDGSYGDHQHVHWALQKPPDMTNEGFERLLKKMVRTTNGLGQQFKVRSYYSEGWLGYMVDHGFDGLMEKLTFTAVCPQH